MHGRQDFEHYSTETIHMYINELMAYRYLRYYIAEAAASLFFWRGQVEMFGVYLPLHSAAAFFLAIMLAEYPSLYPSFFFFSIAWLLLAAQTWRNGTPNPWGESKTFFGFLSALVTGYEIDFPSRQIAAHQNEEEAKALEKRFNDRVERAEKEAEERKKEQTRLMQNSEEIKADTEPTNTDISTKKKSFSIGPLKFILYPIQKYLAKTCRGIRFAKNVFLWNEPYIAFFLTAACLMIGFVFLFVPWAFLFQWTSRIIAWVGFGPHMKLVDIFWYSKFENLSGEERSHQIKQNLKSHLEVVKKREKEAQIQHEEAEKLKRFKQALFGHYILRVPIFRKERLPDVPMHSSSANPYEPSEDDHQDVHVDRIGGQHLVGTMIPKLVEDDDDMDESHLQQDANEKKDV